MYLIRVGYMEGGDMVREHARFVLNIVAFRANDLSGMKDKSVAVRAAVCDIDRRCAPSTRRDDHVADIGSAPMARNRLCQAVAGTGC
jgi:hypothetical protein